VDWALNNGLQLKRRAAECYGSQLAALAASWANGYTDVYETKRYWTLSVKASRQ
jgi:hypothetical protein